MSSTAYWNSLLKQKGIVAEDGKDYGCYRTVLSGLDPSKKYEILQKDSPKTSCAVYVNRQIVAQLGDPFELLKSEPAKGSHSFIQPISFEFYPDADGNAEIIFFISNYFYRKSGLNDTVFFGLSEGFLNNSYVTLYSVICGALLFIGLLCLSQFIINHERREYFYLGMTSIVLSLRIATNGLSLLSIMIPNLSAEIKYKIEYLDYDLLMISLFFIYLVFQSILSTKNDRYFITVLPFMAYFITNTISYIYRYIKAFSIIQYSSLKMYC